MDKPQDEWKSIEGTSTTSQLQRTLLELHQRYTWREIASLPDFRGIPAGSLASYAKGRPVVNPGHRDILGFPRMVAVDVRILMVLLISFRPRRIRKWTRWRDAPVRDVLFALEHRTNLTDL